MRVLKLCAGAVAIAALMLTSAAASAGDITILSGGAAKVGLGDAIPFFEKATGFKAAVEYSPMAPLMKKLADGATPDVVVLTAEVVDEARSKGYIVEGSETEIARVGIGLCVNENAPLPDISTPERLKATLLAAKSIVYIDPNIGTSGKHLAKVFETLGIADAIAAKATLGKGGFVTEPVGRGEIEIGLHQITEILPVRGVKLAGPLPPTLQKVTVYIGAVTTKAKDPETARRFLAEMRTADVRAAFAKRGYME